MLSWKKKKNLALAAVIGVSFFAAAPAPANAAYTQEDLNDELTMAAAWMQNSAEYRELCYQAYNIALERVEAAVANHKPGDKPLAIVLDADETVVGNSAFESGLIGTDRSYSTKEWTAWCQAAKAAAMPGATEYLQAVDKLGVAIFYVTNRSMEDQYEGTAKNMKEIGFPQVDAEHLLLKTDNSNKQPRFDKVLEKYDVVVFMGDNAGDLPLGTYKKNQEERNGLIDANKKDFGRRFIAFPNPTYGDWEPALLKTGEFGDYWKLSPEEKSKARKAALKMWRPSDEEK